MTQVEYRQYKTADYIQCEKLVNQAWRFDDIFAPPALADFAKCIYTQGAVVAGNYHMVAEIDGEVAGFIFGFNEHGEKPKGKFIFGLKILFRLLTVKSAKPNGKKALIDAIGVHQKNRSNLIGSGQSEIMLFVINKKFQRQGIGTALWNGFKAECIKDSVNTIIVETNKLGASSFYEQLGFGHLGNFDSPLHEFATKGGQACLYGYTCR